MTSILKRGLEVYRRDGLLSLLAKLPRLLDLILRMRPLDDICLVLSKRKLRRRMKGETSPEDTLDTAFSFSGYGRYESIEPMQVRAEWQAVIDELAAREPDVVMEIGTANGGTLYTLARLPTVSTVISVDLPEGDYGGGYSKRKVPFYRSFVTDTSLHLLRGDSHEEGTRDQVAEALQGDELDFLLIDGDHTYDGVKQDFEMYSSLVASDGIIALDDLRTYRRDGASRETQGVHKLWDRVESRYASREVKSDDPDVREKGLGLLFMDGDAK